MVSILVYVYMLLLVGFTRGTTWSTSNRVVTHEGRPLVIKGVAMNGIESDCRVPLGLDRRPLSWHFDTMKDSGFNAIRLPLSFEVMEDLSLSVLCSQGEFPPPTPLRSVIQRYLDEAQARSMFLLLDLHTIGGSITPLPWTWAVDESRVINAWVNVVKTFGNHPALMGIEIKNEPHNECSTRDFFNHCHRVIEAIERSVPGFGGLYFISGVQANGAPWGGAFQMDGLSDTTMLSLNTPMERLVLNPHVYGPSVRGSQALSDGPGMWEQAYGFITHSNTIWNQSAVVVTEWGGRMGYDDLDYYSGRWMDWHVNQKGFAAGGFYWTFGPFSDDTGGLVDDGYRIIQTKLDTVNRLDGLSRRVAGLPANPPHPTNRLRGGSSRP